MVVQKVGLEINTQKAKCLAIEIDMSNVSLYNDEMYGCGE